MLEIHGSSRRFCDGVSRRGFLQIGALGLGGLTLADVLRADARTPGGRRLSVINIYLAGGPSHIDTFDPKPNAPPEFRGEFKPIETCVPGIEICEHLPRTARLMDKAAIIRSIAGLRDEHTPNQTESGWSFEALRSIGGHPHLGAVIARLQGAEDAGTPPFVDLTGHTDPGFLGPVYGAFRPDGPGRANLTLNQITVDRLGDRRSLLQSLDTLRRDADASGSMEALDSFTQRAVGVITSGTMARALDLEREDPRLREKYRGGNRDNSENDRFLTARRLIEAGVRCVSFSWGGWDTHERNFVHLGQQLPRMDHGLSTLIEDLDARGMLDETLVLVWGEFGRTPRVNGSAGRDHWPYVASLFMAGGGFKMGQVIGSSNARGETPKDRPVHLQTIFATIYHRMGIDPRYTTMIDPNGRPQYLVDERDTIPELLG